MLTNRQERALEIARQCGADGVLAADPRTVAWLSGISPQVELGPSSFSYPPVVLMTKDGHQVAIVSEDHATLAQDKGCEVVVYPGYSMAPLDPLGHFESALKRTIAGQKIATEPGFLPFTLSGLLDVIDVSRDLSLARAVKDPEEIERIRAAVMIADAGQAAVRKFASPGRSEFEVWQDVREMELTAGSRLPIAVDLISGSRTAMIDGSPGSRLISEGDLVLTDLLCRMNGYWSDSCTTFSIGEPSLWALGAHRKVQDRLMAAIDAVQPGVLAGDLDARMRLGMNYPHHSGHGIGTSYHEEPRIVPDSPTVLKPGMVIALEPALYSELEGVRLEVVVLVTEDGSEVLSNHGLNL